MGPLPTLQHATGFCQRMRRWPVESTGDLTLLIALSQLSNSSKLRHSPRPRLPPSDVASNRTCHGLGVLSLNHSWCAS
jgi:hypothetical protein